MLVSWYIYLHCSKMSRKCSINNEDPLCILNNEENWNLSDILEDETSISMVKDFNINITSNSLINDKGWVKDASLLKQELQILDNSLSENIGKNIDN